MLLFSIIFHLMITFETAVDVSDAYDLVVNSLSVSVRNNTIVLPHVCILKSLVYTYRSQMMMISLLQRDVMISARFPFDISFVVYKYMCLYKYI